MALARRFKVPHHDVFPFGAYLVSEVTPVYDFEKSTREVNTWSMTLRYRSGWSAGRPTYSSRVNPRARANDRSPPSQRTAALASSFAVSLELAREGVVELKQLEPFAPIYLRGRPASAAKLPASNT